MEDILGNDGLVADNGAMQPLEEAMANIKFVGLYFGAHWAPC